MDVIGRAKIWSFDASSQKPVALTNSEIRQQEAHWVKDYMDLVQKVAHLQFLNRDHVLLFRGKPEDYPTAKGNTMLRPRMFRDLGRGDKKRDNLEKRYNRLRLAEQKLIDAFDAKKLPGRERLKRQNLIRWSILQHYGVCRTPLFDVTHSLRIAASFASEGNPHKAFVFALGVPNLSGAITTSAEYTLQIVRLSSVCPPSALRPHIQEGYLLGEYPEMIDYQQQRRYKIFETDFGRRLIAKFKFNPKRFCKNNDPFPKVSKAALYPNRRDPLFKLTQAIIEKLPVEP